MYVSLFCSVPGSPARGDPYPVVGDRVPDPRVRPHLRPATQGHQAQAQGPHQEDAVGVRKQPPATNAL